MNTTSRFGHREVAYTLLRIAFGVNFLGHGAIRVYHGIGGFAAQTAANLSKSPLPHSFVLGFGYLIPWIEVVLGVALILGLFTRLALSLGALFMISLTIGVASNQQWDTAGQQLLYSLVFFVLLFLLDHNRLSLDSLR